jgi:hypothetical protein
MKHIVNPVLILFIFLSGLICLLTCSIAKEWTHTFGGTANEFGYSVQKTTDSGFIIAGITQFYEGKWNDIYLIKTNSSGEAVWMNTFGGELWEVGYAVQETTDRGFIITGITQSYGAGENDIYLIRANNP